MRVTAINITAHSLAVPTISLMVPDSSLTKRWVPHLSSNVDILIKTDVSIVLNVLLLLFISWQFLEGRNRKYHLHLGLSILVIFTVILRTFQSPLTLAMSSSIILGERLRGPILGVREGVAPTSPRVHLWYMIWISLGSNLGGMVEAAGVRRPQIKDSCRKLHLGHLQTKS